MELTAFFKFLYKNLKVLILIPVLTVIITYFLVKSLPDAYIAQGQISTGVVDKSGEIDLTGGPSLQPNEIEQIFSNLIQRIQMQNTLNLVSYDLIMHDLDPSKVPFKKPSKKVENLSLEDRKQLMLLASSKHKNQQPLSGSNKEDARLVEVIASMKYDIGSIKDKLSVNRIAQSDYISVSFNSDNADLSAFVVNAVSTEFINNYNSMVQKTGERSVDYLSNQLVEKQNDLNYKMGILKYYKIRNNVLNLPEQARIIFGQMIDVENRQADVQRNIVSIAGAIKAIDNKFNARDRRYFEQALTKTNSDLALLKEKSKIISDKYIDSDFDPVYKKMADSLQVLTADKLKESSDEYIFNPLATKQELVARKITLQTEYELARHSVNSLNNLHGRLFSQFTRLVPFEASIQSYERDIDIASKEYLNTLDRYNNTSMQTAFVAKLKLSQPATAGVLQPSKKMLLIILSGVISFVFCVIVLFVLFYLDDAIQTAKQLANSTALPVIGQLELIASSKLKINELWNGEPATMQLKNFKDQLRAIRLELNQELAGAKIVAISSFTPGEGKTFLALNLAYAYAVTNKKILLIDGNFTHPLLTNSVKHGEISYVEDFLYNGELNQTYMEDTSITVLGNKGGNKSVLELANQDTTIDRFNYLKSIYDLILIETPALDDTESSKEWMLFAEKMIGVFEHKTYITDAKKEQLTYLTGLNKQFIGWIFNKLPLNTSQKPPKKA